MRLTAPAEADIEEDAGENDCALRKVSHDGSAALAQMTFS